MNITLSPFVSSTVTVIITLSHSVYSSVIMIITLSHSVYSSVMMFYTCITVYSWCLVCWLYPGRNADQQTTLPRETLYPLHVRSLHLKYWNVGDISNRNWILESIVIRDVNIWLWNIRIYIMKQLIFLLLSIIIFNNIFISDPKL